MVEKIIVNPESIRAYGNIIVPKTGADFNEYNCTMEVGEDTISNETVTVYVLTPETTTIELALTSDVSTVTAGGNVVLSVTVTEDEEPVTGQSVSFKLGNDEVGTGTTNSSGVATYTYATTTSGSLNFTASYAGHSSNTVNVVCNRKSTSTALALSSNSIIVGGSSTATATVTSSSTGVNGLTVSFKDGNTVLGTSTTNSNGVATYSLSGLSVGSHTITAVVTETDVYSSSTSTGSTLTVLDHSYSLAFSQASYAASGGSATLSLTLTDNSVPVNGASVSVTGSDSSTYSGTTDSSGVAEVTVSVSAETTFTATYSNVTDTCTVTVSSVIWEDDFTNGLTSNWVSVGKNGNVSVSNNQLNVSCSTDGGRAGAYYNQQVTGSYKVTVDLASASYDCYAFGLKLNTNNWTFYESQPKWAACLQTVPNTGGRATQSNESRTSGISYTTATLVFEITKDTSIKTYVNGTLKQTYTCNNGTTDGYVGIVQCCTRTTKINSIKVEAL